jgi:hypothetical protein
VNVVEVVRVGPFHSTQAPDLTWLLAYAEAFFPGCEVRIAPEALTLAQVCGVRGGSGGGNGGVRGGGSGGARSVGFGNGIVGGPREGAEGQLQLECADVMRALVAAKKDRRVLCSVAVTMADLYPVKASPS